MSKIKEYYIIETNYPVETMRPCFISKDHADISINQYGPKQNAVRLVEYSEYQKLIEALKEAAEYHQVDDVNGEAGYIAWKCLRELGVIDESK